PADPDSQPRNRRRDPHGIPALRPSAFSTVWKIVEACPADLAGRRGVRMDAPCHEFHQGLHSYALGVQRRAVRRVSFRKKPRALRAPRPCPCIQIDMGDSREIRYSILDLAMVPEGDTPADAFRRSLEVARCAETRGYTRFWLAEHHNMPGIASAATT